MRFRHGIAIFLMALTLAGCVTSYKMEVQQGNVVTQEMIEKLRPGMTKSQVRFVLGTPLITDPFHASRWDYVHVYQKHMGAPSETRQFTVYFDGDTLARVEDDGQLLALPTPPVGDSARELSDATPDADNAASRISRAL